MVKQNQTSKNKNETERKSQTSLSQRSGESGTEIVRRDNTGWTGSPFAFMRRFSEEMDRLFEDFGFGRGLLAPGLERGLDRLGTLAENKWAPQVEVIQRDNRLIVRADLPGMTKDDVNVDIDDNSLVIRGERKSEREENEKGYYRSERSYGSFYRQIPLPRGVNAEEANADFRNGVLEITMPVPKEAERGRRQLEIRGDTAEPPRAKASAAAKGK